MLNFVQKKRLGVAPSYATPRHAHFRPVFLRSCIIYGTSIKATSCDVLLSPPVDSAPPYALPRRAQPLCSPWPCLGAGVRASFAIARPIHPVNHVAT